MCIFAHAGYNLCDNFKSEYQPKNTNSLWQIVKKNSFQIFSPVSTQEWMDKITVDLKGADFEKKLVWKTNEGFKVKPFYRQEDLEGLKTTEGLPGQYPYIRGIKKDDNTWFIRQALP